MVAHGHMPIQLLSSKPLLSVRPAQTAITTVRASRPNVPVHQGLRGYTATVVPLRTMATQNVRQMQHATRSRGMHAHPPPRPASSGTKAFSHTARGDRSVWSPHLTRSTPTRFLACRLWTDYGGRTPSHSRSATSTDVAQNSKVEVGYANGRKQQSRSMCETRGVGWM